jgi:hypothetical protein
MAVSGEHAEGSFLMQLNNQALTCPKSETYFIIPISIPMIKNYKQLLQQSTG